MENISSVSNIWKRIKTSLHYRIIFAPGMDSLYRFYQERYIRRARKKNTIKVRAFEQVKDGTNYLSSAKQIFGKHYDIFWNMHNNMEVVNAVRQEQLREYIHRTALSVTYYQDYGWPAVKL